MGASKQTFSWNRVARGLYVETTNRFVINEDEPGYWTIRQLLDWGPTLSGKLFPDYGGITYGEYRTLAEAKRGAEDLHELDLIEHAEYHGGKYHGWR